MCLDIHCFKFVKRGVSPQSLPILNCASPQHACLPHLQRMQPARFTDTGQWQMQKNNVIWSILACKDILKFASTNQTKGAVIPKEVHQALDTAISYRGCSSASVIRRRVPMALESRLCFRRCLMTSVSDAAVPFCHRVWELTLHGHCLATN